MQEDDNVFTGTDEPFNRDYFSTQRSRMRVAALKNNLIAKNQTLYDLRIFKILGDP